MKLELKHITPYLPWKLNIYVDNDLRGHVHPYSFELTIEGLKRFLDSEHKPILRPLSDLTKEIEVDGEKFIPMIELAKIANGNWDEDEFFKGELTNPKATERLASGETTAYICTWETFVGSTGRAILNYNKGFQSYYYFRDDMSDVSLSVTNNQKMLWDKLYQWHFDLNGLIGKKEAIDINTINQGVEPLN